MSSHKTPAIDLCDVTVRYGDVLALERASVTINPGRVCGVVGMNGAGKSTLFKSIMGLVRPDTGTITILGRDPAQARRAGLISHVPQSEEVDWDFPISVSEVVMTGRYGKLGLTRRARRADRAAVADALARVELTELARRQVGRLSGGQRKRAFVARGIAQEARVLLLDEPFAGVDKKSERAMIRLLAELANTGVTVLVSTHDLAALPRLADEAFLLRNTVLAHGSPEAMLHPDQLTRAFGLDPLESAEAEPR